MTMTLGTYFIKQVRDGEHDFTDHEKHSFVRHDGSTYWYDLSTDECTLDEFKSAVMDAWDIFPEVCEFEIGIYDEESGTFWCHID